MAEHAGSADHARGPKMVTAIPGELVCFQFTAAQVPGPEALRSAYGQVRETVVAHTPGSRMDQIEPPVLEIAPASGTGKADCLLDCLMRQLGLNTVVEITAIGAGAPVVNKRFVTPGSSPRISLASKYIPRVLPKGFQTLPGRVWAPTAVRPLAVSKVTGRVIARWIPLVGWGLMAWDVARIGRCAARCGEGE